jgi:hypothetical protein
MAHILHNRRVKMDNMDLKIRKLQQYIVNYLNSIDDIPVEVKRLLVYEIYNELTKASNTEIKTQQEKLAREED